jgi:oligoendopeptidase F
MSVLYKYYDLKKEVLSLDELHLYDIYLEMVKSLDKEYTFEEAKEIVLKALQPLGDNYINDLKQAFSQKWIDIYNNEGKRTGAYSSGGYDTYPYVLLNYEGKLKDVSTLAHELGHSMHSYYSVKNNTYPNYSYKIFVAEVASTVNELLLNYYLLNNSNDKEEKLYILNSLMELFKGTIYRQTMFAEFEKNMHEKYENGEVLTNELLCCEYYKLNKEYFGSNVVVDDEIKYEWERIPHFYYNFYVYKYAIGLSCACYIVDGILNKKEKALENYLKFLSLGGSDYPANELKLAGIDITSSEVVESAIKMFNDTIEQFKEISK